ncbi:hypothetical protein N665_0048s0002 [Sinapis alba]|nr:hypothetical protein N665_0048s0002 [Sinapis alba]
MALCHFPINLHIVSSSSSSSSFHPLASYVSPNLWIRRLRFDRFSHTIQLIAIRATIDTHPIKTKKKRKPKTGFFEDISDKWSSQISLKDNNFPWPKKQEEEQTQHHHEEGELNQSSGSGLTGKKTDSNLRSSFPRPSSGYMSAPWKDNDSISRDDGDGGRGMVESGREKEVWRSRRSNTVEAERVLPEHELSRPRSVPLRMVERFKVGSAGITHALVEAIHEKWEDDEVVKLRFGEPFSLNMKRTHKILEKKTGGLVIWRSGSSVVLYIGISYKLKCVHSFIKQNNLGEERDYIAEEANYPKNIPIEKLSELCELNDLFDEIGSRFHDWTGCAPLPVDADLLPPMVLGYMCPFRILPQGVKPCLSNKERQRCVGSLGLALHILLHILQGLAVAMVKLWGKSKIAKIAIKRGVENTRNERMAEELKRLTRGVLVSRNKEYIVFYRGNDSMPPAVSEALNERQKEITKVLQTKEDQPRETASTRVTLTLTLQSKPPKTPLLAGTLAETIAASSWWAPEASSIDIEELKRESHSMKRSALIRDLDLRLLYALAKVQKDLDPSDLPTDSEIITEEERLLFRKIGLSMDPFLLVGRREVYDGTIENMHLHWKHRELVKIIVRGKSLPQVKHIAISLEAESVGVLVSVDNTLKGYAIILYHGKNYQMPFRLRPSNLLTRKRLSLDPLSFKEEEDRETQKKSDGEEDNLYLRVDESDFSSDEDESLEWESERNETFLSSEDEEEET